MKMAVFSSKPYDAKFLVAGNVGGAHELDFLRRKTQSAYRKAAQGHKFNLPAFVNDVLNARVLDISHAP
jgi:hypothetical protein